MAKNNIVRVNFSALARAIGRERSYVWRVWTGRVKSRKTQELIAEALGIPYEELWGEEEK